MKFLTQPLLETIMISMEERIMQCWQLVDELDYIADLVEDSDDALNLILGLKQLYQMKFEKLWEAFEDSLNPNPIFPNFPQGSFTLD